jgi:hypothetical protein
VASSVHACALVRHRVAIASAAGALADVSAQAATVQFPTPGLLVACRGGEPSEASAALGL